MGGTAPMAKTLILRSWKSDFYRNEILASPGVYTPAELRTLSSHGVNAIWLRALLWELVPSRIFPGPGRAGSSKQIRALNTVVERAARHGIGVYLFMNEPCGPDAGDPFWKKHRRVRGEPVTIREADSRGRPHDRTYYSMCTSVPEVGDYLEESLFTLFSRVDGLAGVITITASENKTHCYSHIDCTGSYKGIAYCPFGSPEEMHCPRCRERSPVDVVAEVIRRMHAGMRRADRKAKLVAWNWSWDLYEPDPQKRIMARLPDDVVIMSGFERGGSRMRGRKKIKVDEYSLGYVGPSEKFLAVCREAKRTGRRVMAKLQVGTTHELATVPNLPLVGNLYGKYRALARLGVEDAMAGWNFGNMPSLNTYATGRAMAARKLPGKREFLDRTAREYFPGLRKPGREKLQKAWRAFASAMEYYPFSIDFLYAGPANHALSYWIPPGPLKGETVGRAWMMDRRGDDLSESLGKLGLGELTGHLRQLAAGWQRGLQLYEEALGGRRDRHSREEYASAVIAGCCFTSTLHAYEAYALCSGWRESRQEAYLELCSKELENCRRALPLLARDSRLGYHGECHGYMFDTKTVGKKAARLERWLAGRRTGD